MTACMRYPRAEDSRRGRLLRVRTAGVGAIVIAAVLLTSCSSDPEPVYQDTKEPVAIVAEYDATLEPSAAVLALVPEWATSLEVTDFEQLRLTLGFADLDSRSPAADRARFAAAVQKSSALSSGLLRTDDARLRTDFRFGIDDVDWQATYDGPEGGGWIIAFDDDVSMAAVGRAAKAGVGPLRGAVVDSARHLAGSQAFPDAADSWGADSAIVELAGRQASATYIERGCVPFDDVFGPGVEAELADAPRAALDELEPLDGYAVALGTELTTVQLGPERSDVFDRLQIADVMPRTDPDFNLAFSRGVADPSTGRLGFDLPKPAVAARLVESRELPFAVCAP